MDGNQEILLENGDINRIEPSNFVPVIIITNLILFNIINPYIEYLKIHNWRKTSFLF